MSLLTKIADSPMVQGCVEWFREVFETEPAAVMTPSLTEQLMSVQRELQDTNDLLGEIIDSLRPMTEAPPSRETVVGLVQSLVTELNWQRFMEDFPSLPAEPFDPTQTVTCEAPLVFVTEPAKKIRKTRKPKAEAAIVVAPAKKPRKVSQKKSAKPRNKS